MAESPLAAPMLTCDSCSLRKGCSRVVPGIGPLVARVMFVGEGPGKKEDEKGEPFVGTAGRFLNSLLEVAGLKREEVYITNVLKCRPPRDATPTLKQINDCYKWLDLELQVIKPEILVAMGATAFKRFTLGGTVEHLHGKPLRRDLNGRQTVILPAYHPAAGLHETGNIRHIYDDFRVLKALVEGAAPEAFSVKDGIKTYYREVQTASEALDVLRQPQYALDLETVGGRLWSVQVSSRTGEASFIPAKYLNFLYPLSTPKESEVTVHNYLHDSQFIGLPNSLDTMVAAYLLGLPQGLKELASRLCGMEMQSYDELVRPYRREKALRYLEIAATKTWATPPLMEEAKWSNKEGRVVVKARKPQPILRKIKRILADSIDKTETDPFERWHKIDQRERAGVEATLGMLPDADLSDIPPEDSRRYACRDADATWRVRQVLLPMIQGNGLDFVLRCVDLPILEMLREMMRIGMALDIEHLKGLSAYLEGKMAGAAERAAYMVGVPFNPQSSIQVAQVIYGRKEDGGLGFPVTGKTPGGGISTDDGELKKVKHPLVDLILEYREAGKLKGTYADSLVEQSRPDSEGVSRIHTTLKATRVATGRLASADPNLQNIPIRTAEGREIRRAFIASPGWVLLDADLGQIEMRTQAHLAKCKGLIQLFLENRDVHTETAAKINGVSLEAARDDKYRYPIKRVGFGIIYIITAKGLNDLFIEEGIEGWDEQRCQQVIRDYYALYPEIREYQQEKVAEARRFGYVKDLFGRIRYIPEVMCPIKAISESGAKMAANMPVTSSAQGIIKLAMSRLWQTREAVGSDANGDSLVRFLMQIHDELLLEVRPWKVEEVARWLKEAMETVVSLDVPIVADVKVGVRWNEMEKMKLEGH